MQQLAPPRRSTQAEREVKLDIDPGWSVPDLTGLLPGTQGAARPALALEATYFDTADLRLARRHVTLRYRSEVEVDGPGEGGAATGVHIWTVKLPPGAGDALARTEVTWDARPAQPSRRVVAALPEAAELVSAITLGRPLQPVAHIATTRRRTHLLTSDGRLLAEIACDTVTGTRLTAPRGTAGARVSFTEVEVELAQGSATEVLDAVVTRLRRAGARSTDRQSKLATVLGLSPGLASSDGSPRRAPPARAGRCTTLAEVFRQQALACLDVIVDHDPSIRLGNPDPEQVHRSRVATRRMRSICRAFYRLVQAGPETEHNEVGQEEVAQGEVEEWLAGLRTELRWLGQALGAARDADVRAQSLRRYCDELAPSDASGAAAVLGEACCGQEKAYEDLLEIMSRERYINLLRRLEAIAKDQDGTPGESGGQAGARGGAAGARGGAAGSQSRPPKELWARLAIPAATGLATLGRLQWRSVKRAVGNLGDNPKQESLHRVRIAVKHLRYIAEVATPVARPGEARNAARQTVAAATELQDILGELHDAAVNEQWLRDLVRSLSRPEDLEQPRTGMAGAGTAAAGTAANLGTALVAGQLIAATRATQRASRRAWPCAWDHLDRKRLALWMAPRGVRAVGPRRAQ